MSKNPPSKTRIIVIAIISAILASIFIGLMVRWLTPRPKYVSLNDFIEKINLAAQDPSDGIYILDLKMDSDLRSATMVFIQDNKKLWLTTGMEYGKMLELRAQDKGPVGSTESYWTILQNALSYVENGENLKGQDHTILVKVQSPLVKWITLLLPTALFGLIIYLVYKAQANMFNGTGAIGEKSNPAIKVKSDKKFSDVAGNVEAIEEIKEIVDYLKNPKKYSLAGARMPKGILLGGPPGTGKTLLAKATAGEANVPFYFISASNFVEMYVGLGAKRVRSVIAEARKNSPAIIFIDELDAIGRTRGSGIGGGNDEREQTLNQILVEMDGIQENKGLLFFAASNRTDILDPALTRPGRFDRTITVGLPDVKEREAILRLHAKGKRISKDVDLSQLAKRTPGYSGAQLENVINEASLLSVRANSEVITRDQIDEAVDRVVAGPAKKNRVITKEELTMVAYHEAGHAVIGLKLKGGNKVQKITIIPRGEAGGYNLMTPEKEKYNASRSELIAMITGFLGGRASEQIIYGQGEVSTGAADDIAKATKIARRMVTEWGMSELGPIQYEEDTSNPFLGRDYAKSSHSNQIGYEIDSEVRKIMLEAEKNAIEIIKKERKLLELIKDALLQKETIVAEEIEYIEKNMQLPPSNLVSNSNEVKKIENFDLDSMIEDIQQDQRKVEEPQTETEMKKESREKAEKISTKKVEKSLTKNKNTKKEEK